jgi:hypothetical protein
MYLLYQALGLSEAYPCRVDLTAGAVKVNLVSP